MPQSDATTDLDRSHSVLHVIARKLGNPPVYYHRQWINAWRWTAWRKIDLDIASDHLLPVVWNRRLYLFWAIINRKPDKDQEKTTMEFSGGYPPDAKMHLEIELAWSELKGQKWLAKQIAPQVLVIRDYVTQAAMPYTGVAIEPFQIVLRSTVQDALLHIDLFSETAKESGIFSHFAQFVLGGVGNAVEAFAIDPTALAGVGPDTRAIGKLSDDSKLGQLVSVQSSRYEAMSLIPESSPTGQRVFPLCVNHSDNGAWVSQVVLNKANLYRLIVPHQYKDFDSRLPFFYEDRLHSYFIIPTFGSRSSPPVTAWYTFFPFYHAFVPLFIRELDRGGPDALFSRRLQLSPAALRGTDSAAFDNYEPRAESVLSPYPAESVDFESNAGYSIYNWELFFHVPFLIGQSLSHNQHFEEAKHWYEYIFNPTSSTVEDPPEHNLHDLAPARGCWITKPFYLMSQNEYAGQRIENLMRLIHTEPQATVKQVDEWLQEPADPHLIAQLRPVAYQRTIVMKYIDNLIAWGDQLFRQDTMESVNEATQMYVLASELLGPRPELVKPLGVPSDLTYADLQEAGLDTFANASVLAAENLLGPVQNSGSVAQTGSESSGADATEVAGYTDPDTTKIHSFDTLYFSIPPNEQLLAYWDTVADRLFKIRHGMSIEGVKRQLALFAPPIDPALLVRAAAAGLDLGSILSDISASLPPYRFRIMVREAIEFCEMVRGFGNEFLGVLEKREAEGLALLHSGYEKTLQDQMTGVLQKRLDEASQQLVVLDQQRQVILERQTFYGQRKDELTNLWETAALVLQSGTLISDTAALSLEVGSAVFHLFPDLQFGGSGGGGSPHATAKWGGENIAQSASAAASALRTTSAILQTMASMSQTIGSYQRRKEDWELQYTLATQELTAHDSQKLAATIRQGIAQKELDNHTTNVDLAYKVDGYLLNKYTNKDLYDWMISQTSATYFQAYQLAYTLAKRAEQCFRRELGLNDSSYIQFGYWDSLKKGLLAGDKLLFDLQRLKSAYYAQNARELELTKNISLLLLDPQALVQLRSKGECTITLPEFLFDLETPGHYMRRIKSVGITVPCVVGPYTSVSMTLTLLDNHVRFNPATDNYQCDAHDGVNANRFVNDQGGVNTIVTSGAQNDRGMFELRFEDDRYLPFECAGAVSSWKLRLNPVYPQFDYNTISDVVIQLQYTARDGGEVLRTSASDSVKQMLNEITLAKSQTGLYRLIDTRHEFGTNWYSFLNPPAGQNRVLSLDITPDCFPFFTRGLELKITQIDFIAKFSSSNPYKVTVTPPSQSSAPPVTVTFNIEQETGVFPGLHYKSCSIGSTGSTGISLGSSSNPEPDATWSFGIQTGKGSEIAATEIKDLLLIIQYQAIKPAETT